MSIALDKPLRVSEMLGLLGSMAQGYVGSSDLVVVAAASLDECDAADAVAFCSTDGEPARREIASSAAAVVLCRPDVAALIDAAVSAKTLIIVGNPRLAFIRVIGGSVAMPGAATKGVAGSAAVSGSARLGKDVAVGEMAMISEGCELGEGTRIDAAVVLYAGTRIGRRCTVQAGAVVGAEGYGFERDADGRLHRFPQLGRVLIEDDVEIGARVCIDRGALGDTSIGHGTKIDDGAYIAHNVAVGAHCLIMAHVLLCGSCAIGNGAEISPGAIIRDKVRVGERARVGLGAVVVRDVLADEVVAGIPARPLNNQQ